ncbi:MAG: zinc-dependent alcohol dehydrogenase [Opitutales bacterium]
MPRRLMFTAPAQIVLEPYEPGKPGPGEVRVRSTVTTISTGTELTLYQGDVEPGSHWDQWIRFPINPGYSTVGVVEAVGPGIDLLAPGDRVAHRRPHADCVVVAADDVARIPDTVSDSDAAWSTLAMIASLGVKAADLGLADSVAVVGAGPIGQLVIRWVAVSGVNRLRVIDPVEPRLALATAGGADATFARSLADCLETRRNRYHLDEPVWTADDHDPPAVIIDTTGAAPVFADAQRAVAWGGRVVLLGDARHPAQQHLTPWLLMKGLTITGAHAFHERSPWSYRESAEAFFRLIAHGRLPMTGLVTDTFPAEQATEAYARAASRDPAVVGIQLTW